MTQLGWGLDPYGLGGFGSAPSVEGTHLVTALATSTHEVRVYLSAEPTHVSTIGDGDALNSLTWTIQRMDSFVYLNAIAVVEYAPTIYGVQVLQPFGPASVEHQISSVTLRNAGGGILLPPRKASFAGALAESEANPLNKLIKQKAVVTDVANTQVPTSAPDVLGGTLVVTSGGDYANVSGAELVRKLIFRRLTTPKGSFFHLPDYGLGVGEKEPMMAAAMPKQKAEIENQVKREPEVVKALAILAVTPDGILRIKVKADLQSTGESVTTTINLPTGGISL